MILTTLKRTFLFMVVIVCQLCFLFKISAQTPSCNAMWSHYNHAKIHQMYFLTDQKWFMVGSFGTVLVTENAGKTWQKVNIRDYFPFIDIDFFNQNEGLITRYAFIPGGVPTPACFVRTIDGGKTWNSIPTPFLPTQLFVTDSVTAYANSWNNQGAYITSSKGNNWRKANINGQEAQSVYFASKELGWVYTKTDIFRTLDGGKNWVKYTMPSFLNNSTQTIHPFVLSKDKTTLWVINIGTKTIGRSTDKGTTWVVSELPDVSFQIQPFSNQKALFVYGESIYETTDGGQTWKEKTKINGHASTNLFFFNEKKGFYVGSHTQVLGNPFGSNSRTIVETDNGGDTWKTISESPLFISLDMLNDKVGYAGSFYGELLKTVDGGITWQILFKKDNALFAKIKIFDENHILLHSPSQQKNVGGVFYTRDKGKTWEESPLDPVFENAMVNVSVFDSLTWIGDYGNQLVKTVDGGKTYQPFQTPQIEGRYRASEINFVDANTLVTIARPFDIDTLTSRIYRSTDSGNSWQLVHSFPMTDYTNAFKIYFKNPKVGFLTSINNNLSHDIPNYIILRTTDGGKTWQEMNSKILNLDVKDYIFHAFDYYDENNFSVMFNDFAALCYSTKDGGKTWGATNSLHPLIKYDKGNQIEYLNKDTLFISGINNPFFNMITPMQNPIPHLGLQGDTLVELGATTLHTLTLNINDSDYKWSLESGGVILGSHIDSVNIKWTRTGYHKLKLTSINSCGESEPSYFTIKVEGASSIRDKSTNVTEVYPNPIDNHLYIKVPESKQVKGIKIIDLMGRQIYALTNLNWENDSFGINVQNISAGIYLLMAELESGQDVHKIIISRL